MEHVSNNTEPGDTFDCPRCGLSIPIPIPRVYPFHLNHNDLSKLQDTLASVKITEGNKRYDVSTDGVRSCTSLGGANVTLGVGLCSSANFSRFD